MKVMLNNALDSQRVVSRGTDCTMKHTTIVPNRNKGQGYSNEEIYNMLMSFKHKISNIFNTQSAVEKNKKLDTVA